VRIIATDFPGLCLLRPKVFRDERGFFLESYSKKTLEGLGLHYEFVQDNQARSETPGTLRGLHFQLPPRAQAKLVRVTRGAAYDVVVDLRLGSPTYAKWYAVTLSEENQLQLLIPKGFAHGYLTLENGVEFMYKVDELYAPDLDAGIIWNDPDLNISWPELAPILSPKDAALPLFSGFSSPFRFNG
jgi:dTDP-4-dehydrorhamnose 3,5-epimerase